MDYGGERKVLLSEHKLKCAQCLNHLNSNGLLEVIQLFNPIAAITEHIKTLASQDKLNKLEEDIKHDYRDIFRPISHISELPMTETTRIQLKNAYQTISK